MVCVSLCIPWQAPEYCTEWNRLLLKPVNMLQRSLLVAQLLKALSVLPSDPGKPPAWNGLMLVCPVANSVESVCLCESFCVSMLSHRACCVCSDCSLGSYAGVQYMFSVAVTTQAARASTVWSPPLCTSLQTLRGELKKRSAHFGKYDLQKINSTVNWMNNIYKLNKSKQLRHFKDLIFFFFGFRVDVWRGMCWEDLE